MLMFYSCKMIFDVGNCENVYAYSHGFWKILVYMKSVACVFDRQEGSF